MIDLLKPAMSKKYAVGAFEFWSLDSAQAVVRAAESLNMPVILQAGPLECQYAGVRELAEIARLVAERSKTDVALHLDHGDTYELIYEAVNVGFTSVMIDASHLEFEKNVFLTKKVADMAHKKGVSVEGELGRIPGSEGNQSSTDAEAYQTDPEEALAYVRSTGINCLAVAIGSAHGFYRFPPALNIERLNRIHRLVDMPLVLHGGSGIPDCQIADSIENGIAKVNICTEFVAEFGRQYIRTQNTEGYKYSVPSLFSPSREAGCELAKGKISLFMHNRTLL